ncbi:MAG: hypothetical protein H7122_01730 [Chitinophagaceae bacterium]|nr:hypothetical protein [Chitinophagaceae bacterium]
MKTVLTSAAIFLLISFTVADQLTGRWESKRSEKGNVTGVVFKSDTSFEAYINKKPFVSGQYTYRDNIFSFVDNGCEGKRGVYKIVFFSNNDSLRFEPVTDSCDQRRGGMSRLVLGRVK